MHIVTVVGYLEPCEVRQAPSDRSVVTKQYQLPLPELYQDGALLGHLEIDCRWRLQAIVLEGCDDLDVEVFGEVCRRMANRGPYPTLDRCSSN